MNHISILSYIITSIFALEQAIPQKGFGSTKKQIIMNGVETIVKATATEANTLAGAGSNVGTNTAISSVAGIAGDFIDSTIAVLNKNKAFAK